MTDDRDQNAPEDPPAEKPAKVTRARAKTVGKAARPPVAEERVVVPVMAEAPARDVTAAHSVTVREGGIREARGDAIDIEKGGIGRAQAMDIAVSKGAIGLAQGDRVSVEMGAVGLAVAKEMRLTQGLTRAMFGGTARAEQAAIGALITGRATIERTTAVGILIAGRVDGNVRPLLDWRGALAFGAVAGLLIGILRRR